MCTNRLKLIMKVNHMVLMSYGADSFVLNVFGYAAKNFTNELVSSIQKLQLANM